MRGHDVIVVGAGIIGCSIGYELARRGASVRIFEARTVGAGATQASAGVLAPYIEAHEGGVLFDLAVRSLAMYDRFVDDAAGASGLPIEYRRCGTLEVAMDAAAASRLQHAASSAAHRDALRWLDAAAARDAEPALPDSIEGALLAQPHGYVAVSALTEALAWAALRHGVQLETAHRVAAVHYRKRLSLITEDGAAWEADEVVVAAGSWAGTIASPGLPAAAVRPIRGQLLRLAWRGTPLGHIIWGPDCYVVPWRDGTVLVGATVEDVGFDERSTAAGVRDLLDAACDLLPEAWRATFEAARVGLRPASLDGLPIIGRWPGARGLIYATGHYRNGVLLAPLTATLVADLVLADREDATLAALSPARFMR
jgi:glycine oxidase